PPPEPGGSCLGERPAEERLDACQPLLGERERAVRAAAADRAARPGGVADERTTGAALRAAAEVRQIARKPEQLELQREAERVERRAARREARQFVEQVEEARQRVE